MKATPLYKYDSEGNFICEYKSYHAAAFAVKRNRANIRKAIRRNNKSAGFYFSEIYLEKYPVDRISKRLILAFKDSDSPKWVECISLSQASKKTNIPVAVIKWLMDNNGRKNSIKFKRLSSSDKPKTEQKFYQEKIEGKPVPVIIQKGKFRKEFKSIKSAAMYLEVRPLIISKTLKSKEKLNGWSIKCM